MLKMEKIISIILISIGFIIAFRYWDFPSDSKVEGILMTNKQKRIYSLIIAFGFIFLGIYILIKICFF